VSYNGMSWSVGLGGCEIVIAPEAVGCTIQLFLVDGDASGIMVASRPSGAGAAVIDRNTNGRTRWHVSGQRLTYHEGQEAKAVTA